MTPLAAEGLAKTYASGDATPVAAVRGVSLSLDAGEITVLTGPSGSGKTTLVNLLVGFEPPDAGEVRWAGVAPGSTPGWAELAVVPQALGLLEELTLAENVALPLRIRAGRIRRPDRTRVDGLLSMLGVAAVAGHRPSEASLGEQQRAAVARALVVQPRVLVLDEPTAHQDATSAARIVAAVADAAWSGTAVLAATHDPDVLEVAHRGLHLVDGRVTG